MTGIIGYMSGGKTYTAVQMMLHFLRFDHRVCTNVRLNCRAVSRYLDRPCVIWKQYYYFLTDTPTGYNEVSLSQYDMWPCGTPRGASDYDKQKVYIFLDEVSSLFDSMVSSADDGIKAVATWARHTEKRGQMLYLIMQFPNELHKRLRVHITGYVECTNTSAIRIPLLGIGMPWGLRNIIIRRELMPDLETVVGSAIWTRLDARIYACYNTGQIVVGTNMQAFKPVSAVADNSEQLYYEQITRFIVAITGLWFFAYLVLRLYTRAKNAG